MDSNDAKLAMIKTAGEPSKYSFNFTEYVMTSLLKAFLCRCFCKCFIESSCYRKRIKRLVRHEEARI